MPLPAPVMVAACVALHAYVVPLKLLPSAMPGAVPLQMDDAEGVAVIRGLGLTLTIAVVEAVQVFAVPIIV